MQSVVTLWKWEQLNLRLADTRDTLSSRVGEVEAELRAAQQQISSKNSALSDRHNEVIKLTEQMAELRQEMVEKEKGFDEQLFLQEKEFEQCLLAKDQPLFEKQNDFETQLFEKQNEFEPKILEKDQQLVEKLKESDQKLTDIKKHFEQLLIAKDQHLTDKQKGLEQSKDEFKQKVHTKDQLLIEKEHTLTQKDQQLL